MLNINWSDVISVLESIRPYLIVMAIAIIVAVIIMFAVKNLEKPKKYLIRTQAFVAMFLVVVVSLNLICTGPLATLLSLISGTGTISEETQSKAEKLCMDIADEGVVLLKNENKILPMTDNKNVNVFGWARSMDCSVSSRFALDLREALLPRPQTPARSPCPVRPNLCSPSPG